MGLVALDVLTALTVGKGRLVRREGRPAPLRRVRHEPTLRLFSRSGSPYCAKAVATVDESDVFEAVVCTKEAVGAIQGGRGTGRPRRQIDFRSTVLPLILAEMQIRYYSQSALLAAASQQRTRCASALSGAWHDGSYDAVVSRPSGRYGEFDPTLHFFGPQSDYVSSKDYESQIYSMVEADLASRSEGARRR